jgi:hypothetical protein
MITSDQLERFAMRLADDIERQMNTGTRCYAVDRPALLSAYRAAHALLRENHDLGDEDRSER